jgi:hypothetical protein
MSKEANPFITNGYISIDYFCDRETELQALKKMQKMISIQPLFRPEDMENQH